MLASTCTSLNVLSYLICKKITVQEIPTYKSRYHMYPAVPQFLLLLFSELIFSCDNLLLFSTGEKSFTVFHRRSP